MYTIIPTVFISYSHDSKKHMTWVAHLARRLSENGINVIFDQWHLTPGANINEFIENAISRSDVVLSD